MQNFQERMPMRSSNELLRTTAKTPNRALFRASSTLKASPPLNHRPEKRVKNQKKKKMNEFLEQVIDHEFEQISQNFLGHARVQT